MELAWFAAFATALCFGVSATVEDYAAKRAPAAEDAASASLVSVVTRLPYVIGMLLSLLGWVLSLLALQRLPLFAVQAIGASSIGVVVVLHRAMTHEPVPRRQSAFLVLLGLGLVALAVSAAPGGPGAVPAGFDVGIWIGVVGLTGLGFVIMRVQGDRGSALLGAVSGLAYGGTALCARGLEADHTLRSVLINALTIALIPFAALCVAMFAAALQRGSVAVATATQHAAMTVVPAAVGLLVLDDHARDGFAPLAWAGFVVTVASVIALTLVHPAPTPVTLVPATPPPAGPTVAPALDV
jgi:multidrug transporter EmrE-like cation transporter